MKATLLCTFATFFLNFVRVQNCTMIVHNMTREQSPPRYFFSSNMAKGHRVLAALCWRPVEKSCFWHLPRIYFICAPSIFITHGAAHLAMVVNAILAFQNIICCIFILFRIVVKNWAP